MIEMHMKEERRGGEGKTVRTIPGQEAVRGVGENHGDQAVRNDQEAKASSGHFFSPRTCLRGLCQVLGP